MLPVKCAFVCHSASSSINGKCIVQEAMTHRLLVDRLSFLSYLDDLAALIAKSLTLKNDILCHRTLSLKYIFLPGWHDTFCQGLDGAHIYFSIDCGNIICRSLDVTICSNNRVSRPNKNYIAHVHHGVIFILMLAFSSNLLFSFRCFYSRHFLR